MTPHVMISFSSKNVPVVEKILRRIEDAGLPCWVSYRDIKQGQNYQGSITAAIRDASAVVFVLCKEFNLSEETKRELSLASSFKKPMVPIRTEAFTFSDELFYVLATVQYIDAFPDFDAALSRMIVRLKEIVASATPPVADAAPSLLPPTAVAGVAAAADKYTETARQVYADGIVTPAERVKLDTARELLDIPVDVAAQIEQRFARAVTAPVAPAATPRPSPATAAADVPAASAPKKIFVPLIALLLIAAGGAAYFLSGDKASEPLSPDRRGSTPSEIHARFSATQRFEAALARADVRSAGIDAIPIVQASPLLDQLAGSMANSDTQTASAITSRLAALPKVDRGARATARKANDRGIAALRANDNAAAVASLRDAVRADPGDVEVIDNLGYAYNLNGDLEAAEFWARVALAVSPTRSSAWLNLGIAGGQQGDESMALGALLLAHKYSGRPDRTINAVQELKDRGNSTAEMRSAAARALERLAP